MCIGYTNRNSDVALSSWKNDKKWFSLALIRHCRNIQTLVRGSSKSLPWEQLWPLVVWTPAKSSSH